MVCKQCGERDINKFYINNKSTCRQCISLRNHQNRKEKGLPKEIKIYKCVDCGEEDVNKFYVTNKKRCKKCVSSMNNDRYHKLSIEGKQAYKDNLKEWNNQNIFRVRYNVGRHRANSKGIIFEIDESQLQLLWEEQQGLCYYSGIQMSLMQDDATYSLSIERKDSSIGYVKDNVVLCCSAVNRMKNKLPSNIFLEFISAIYQKQSSP